METVIRSVAELAMPERSAMERLVGHPLLDDQQLVIRVVGTKVPGVAGHPSESLPDWCNVYEGLSDERIDEIDRAIVRSPSSRDFLP